jgi:signal transduction histidine kinase
VLIDCRLRGIVVKKDRSVDQELEDLRKENALLKQLISELPNGVQRLRDEIKITSSFHHFEETEALLSIILDYVPHHIVFVDRDGIITLCNLQTAQDLKIDRDQMIGKHIRDLLQIPDEQIALMETLRTGKEIVDREVLDSNYGILNTRILWNEDGTIKRAIGIFYFLNVIKEAEKQALAGRIAAGIAHEIRNPLTTVRGYLQFLVKEVDEKTSSLFTNLLIPEIDRANKIISDFLSIAKPAHLQTEKIQIGSFLTDYLGKFFKSEALLYGIQMDIELDSDTENVYIHGNKEELLQVFMNLFLNSLQAKNNQPLKIKLSAKLAVSIVQIVFADNGKGIPANILNQIFDPFFSTKDSGTGLGLSVSRKIIENHGGFMYVNSNAEGTSFVIDIPYILEV